MRARRPIAIRFWEKVDLDGPGGCWLWGGVLHPDGYGDFRPVAGRPKMKAHRYAYIALEGPIPEGLDLDHLCRVRNCVNPDHLEPVTRAENVRRGLAPIVNSARGRAMTACRQGHAFDEHNTYITPDGRRNCRRCRAAADARHAARRKVDG